MISDFFIILYWWFWFFLLGTIGLPLAFLFFRKFFDFGFLFSKVLAILILLSSLLILFWGLVVFFIYKRKQTRISTSKWICANISRGSITNFEKFLVLLPIFLFLSLLLPFLNSFPHRDGNIEFVESFDFYSKGLNGYLLKWREAAHPPLKQFLVATLFSFFKVSPFTYNILGLIIGTLGIFSFYLLVTHLFQDAKLALLTSSLLATHPLFIANALFALRDFLVSVFLIFTLYFYLKDREILYVIFATLLVYIKETALVFPLVVLSIDLIFRIRDIRKMLKKIILNAIPLFAFLVWLWKLKSLNLSVWSAHILSGGHNPFKIVMYNLASLVFLQFAKGGEFLNEQAKQQWKQLFFLNFNWIFWFVFCFGLIFWIVKISKKKPSFSQNASVVKTLLTIWLFPLAHIFTVLTFPTYAIPRYALPVIPFLLIGTSWAICNIFTRWLRILCLVVIIIIVPLSLFTSSDPISIKLWNKEKFLGEEVYPLYLTWAGNDGIVYNWQYLKIVKKRTEAIKSIEEGKNTLTPEDCGFIFPDPNNDYQTFRILNLEKLWQNPLCELR